MPKLTVLCKKFLMWISDMIWPMQEVHRTLEQLTRESNLLTAELNDERVRAAMMRGLSAHDIEQDAPITRRRPRVRLTHIQHVAVAHAMARAAHSSELGGVLSRHTHTGPYIVQRHITNPADVHPQLSARITLTLPSPMACAITAHATRPPRLTARELHMQRYERDHTHGCL